MKLTGLTMAGLLVAGAAFANTVVPDEVSFGEYGAVEASLSGTEGNADKGREIFSTKSMGNCVSCHQVSQLSAIVTKGNN